MRARTRTAGLLVACALAFAGPCAAHASAAELIVDEVDATRYPQMAVTLRLPGEFEAAGSPALRVWENDVAIEGVSAGAASSERAPVDVALLLDASGSMSGKPAAEARRAARRFVEAMSPQDRISVVVFNDRVRQVTPFTSDRSRLLRAIDAIEARGETALYDGIVKSAALLQRSRGSSRYVVLLSDGGDTVSGASLDDAAKAVERAGSSVYAVALRSPEYDGKALRALTRSTGGKLSSARDPEALSDVFSGIADELRNVVVALFVSLEPNTKDIDVRVLAEQGGSRAEGRRTVPNPRFEARLGHSSAPPPNPLNPVLSVAAISSVGIAVFLSVALATVWLLLRFERKRGPMELLDSYAARPRQSRRVGAGVDAESSKSRVIAAVDSIAAERGYAAIIGEMLERAGLALRPMEFIYFHFLGTLAVVLMTWWATGNVAAFMLAVAMTVVAPLFVLRFLASRRRKAFETQLPNILSLMAGSLRAGWGLQQSIDLVVQQSVEPVRSEFARAQAQVRLGIPLEEALGTVAQRVQSADFAWAVTAIGIQREVGGNLAEVLDIVASTIRERGQLREHVIALTAEGRFSALILGVMPFVLLATMAVLMPTYVGALFATTIGQAMLALGLVMLVIGLIWLGRLMKIEV